jgi:eukaryotic-like serine/threonine-protein kinase
MAMNPRARRRRANPQRSWPGPRPSPTTDPRRVHRRQPAPSPRHIRAPGPAAASTLEAILDDFTRSWERGERPRAEGYLARLPLGDSAELIYHEYCLAEASDLEPDPAEYLRRFPEHADALGRLFGLHGALPASMLRSWVEPAELPSTGDEIGPYRLVRELGRGAFARVFLAEQSDLDHRLVVVKVSTRLTAEPRLLARARHAHIVEVLRHVAADDGALHLVCMPFLGGATLASVLEGRRKSGRPARSGRDLLSDLDLASAPEYPAAGLARPAREIIAGLSYPQALAWIVARLAEALDHAHGRGVAHGDLKPSNILLTAEATPMLFDFNLAVDWHEALGREPAPDAGGTLAYMAPERLRAIAEGRADGVSQAVDLHRADLYALGLVLLEALTGRMPEVPSRKPSDPRGLAEALARARRDLPGPLRGRGPGAIPPTLRSILERCLAPEPDHRYARGGELAADLDRWRSDQPLAFAREPIRSGLARQARRNRRPLIAGTLTLASALVVGSIASLVLLGSKRDQAVDYEAPLLDRPDLGAYHLRQFGHQHSEDWGDPVENTTRQLARYGVEADPDWRARDNFRWLPDRNREEMEAWLLEQVLRHAVALGERPDSPGDWKRALVLLEQTVARTPLEPLKLEILALRSRLNLPRPEVAAGPDDAIRPPIWLKDYIAGVSAEPLHARKALGHYLDALRTRPDLYWAHYRIAAVACRIDEFPLAVEHLRRCLTRHPRNPALHAMLASTLYHVARDASDDLGHNLMTEALRECDLALELDPDFSQAHQIRALLRQTSGLDEGVRTDVARFDLLTRFRDQVRQLDLRLGLQIQPGLHYMQVPEPAKVLAQQALSIEPGDYETRALLASGLARDGRRAEAIEQYDQVLSVNPDHLRARYNKALLQYRLQPEAGIVELASLIDHPRFEEVFPEEPTALRAFHYVATDLLKRGKIAEALTVAHRGLEHLNRSRSFRLETILARSVASHKAEYSPRGETYYLLARIHAAAAETDRGRLPLAIEYLDRSFAANNKFRDVWFPQDQRFDGLRDEIRERIAVVPVSQ